jgi:hypothetical protein
VLISGSAPFLAAAAALSSVVSFAVRPRHAWISAKLAVIGGDMTGSRRLRGEVGEGVGVGNLGFWRMERDGDPRLERVAAARRLMRILD